MDKATIHTETNLTYEKATIITASGKKFEIKIFRDGGEEIEIYSPDSVTILPIYSNNIRIK